MAPCTCVFFSKKHLPFPGHCSGGPTISADQRQVALTWDLMLEKTVRRLFPCLLQCQGISLMPHAKLMIWMNLNELKVLIFSQEVMLLLF